MERSSNPMAGSDSAYKSNRRVRRVRRAILALGLLAAVAGIGRYGSGAWYSWFEKKVVVVEPGRLVRGAWQRPGPLRCVLAREKIKTIVTLVGTPLDSERYRDQERVVRETGVRWVVVPVVTSRPTLAQMAEEADLLADRAAQPIFFHCIAGHHRTSLALAAYRIRHEGWSAERACCEAAALPWVDGDEEDAEDRRLIEQFAAENAAGQLAPPTPRFAYFPIAPLARLEVPSALAASK